MTADVLLNGEAAIGRTRSVSRETRTRLRHDVDGRPDADPRTETDHERVVVIHDFFGKRIRVVYPDRLDVERGNLADAPRHNRAERRCFRVLEVVGGLRGRDDRDLERQRVILPEQPVLREELDRLVAVAVNANLPVRDDAEAILEADLRAIVEAEEVAR